MIPSWEPQQSVRRSNGVSFSTDGAATTRLSMINALHAQGANTVPVFCYPNGDFDSNVASKVRAAGYKAAVTTRYGIEGRALKDPFALKRVCIHQDIAKSLPLFAFHLSGFNRR